MFRLSHFPAKQILFTVLCALYHAGDTEYHILISLSIALRIFNPVTCYSLLPVSEGLSKDFYPFGW